MRDGDAVRPPTPKISGKLSMQRLVEIILGLQKGFLQQSGHFSVEFNSSWPLQKYVGGAAVWNFVLGLAALMLVIYVYRREGRTRKSKVLLGVLRGALLALVLVLLNRPVLTLGQVRREPSVLALLIDDSISMKVKDVSGPDGKPMSRLDGIIDLLDGRDGALLRQLASVHTVRIYDFSRGARQIAAVAGPAGENPTTRPDDSSIAQATGALDQLKPEGDGTQVVSSLKSVLEDLQGQRVAGVVVLTDGRETPTAAQPEAVADVKSFGVNIYPVAVGTDRMPRNIAIQSVSFEESAFVDDITNLKVKIRASGYEPNHPLTLTLQREVAHNGQKTREPVLDEHGQKVTRQVIAADDKPFDVDMQFRPTAGDIPTANLVVTVEPQPGALDEAGNYYPVQLDVLDDNISVLYVDGYPRWDYRYIKNSMLRDRTVKISCLLTSADPAFRQEGSDDPNRPTKTWAITAFPTSPEQLLDYDVVLLGDVDPRQFTDAQLQMISDFVSKKGGGFEMVAGPRWSPSAFRNTPIEPLLPVLITHVEPDDSRTSITEGFRPVVTKAGADSSIFRFFPDAVVNDEYVRNHLQPLFWYCRGIMVKPGVGIVFAEHPSDVGPDNRKAPILVVGRFGAGRTIFSGIDESWRWRYYTGESIFNTYWVQQFCYLARGRKLGQRKLTFTRDQDIYEVGKQVTLRVRILSADLLQQLSPPLSVEVVDDATNQPVRRLDLNRQEGATDIFSGSFTADKVGKFTVKLAQIGGETKSVSYTVATPQLELVDPTVDMAALSRLATDVPIPLPQAAAKLPLIRSASRLIPVPNTPQPLWNAPLVMVVFVTLITVEWILRKINGML
jgi:uncharacterized membrane protein